MKRLLYLPFLSLPLVGCYGGERASTGQCPAGETCSDLTPHGLDFVGNHLVGELLLSGPRPTAIGGTQAVALQYDRGDGVDIALDLPFTADDDGGLGVKVDATSGSQVVVRGAGSRSNYLRILDQDGLLMDRKELSGAALDTIALVTEDFETVPNGMQLAFAQGARTFGVALYGNVQTSTGPQSQRLIDTSMDLQLAGAEKKAWDTLSINATVGTSALAVTAGDKPTLSLDVVVVDHADSVAPIQPAPSTIMTNGSASICFAATAASRYVAGLTWTYVIDGTETQTKGDGSLDRNCVSVSTTRTSGTVTVQASAGGQSTAMALAIGAGLTAGPDGSMTRGGAGRESTATGAALTDKPERAVSHALPTAGDRAAM